MLKKVFITLSAAALLAACNNPAANKQSAADSPKTFGAEITADNAISYDELLTKMNGVDSLPAKVEAKVGDVCQMKGCWLTLVSDQPGKPEMRVTFKDYAFFVPKDLGGKKVVVDGYAYMETTSVDDLRHYAEDAGKSKAEIEAIKEPEHELAFEARGVRIVD